MSASIYYGVPHKVWDMWTEDGQWAFAVLMESDSFGSVDEVAKWNGAFVAACEASGLNVEFPARD